LHAITVDTARLSGPITATLSSRRNLVSALVLLVLGTYSSSLAGDFVYDDRRVVVANPLVGHWDWHTLGVIFTRDYWAAYNSVSGGGQIESFYYRPFVHMYELVAYSLVGRNAIGWHLLSVLLHALAAILVMLVLEKSLAAASSLEAKQRRLVAALAAAIFALHPVQGEAVAWISAFANPLGSVFSLGSFYCYLRYRESRKALVIAAAAVLMAAAVLTKETGLVLPGLIIAHELFIFDRERALSARIRAAAIMALPFAGAAAVYFVLRYRALNVLVGKEANLNFPDDASLSLLDTLRTVPALLLAYLRLALMPLKHSMMYDFGPVRSFGGFSFWLPLALCIALGGLLIYFCKRWIEIRIAAAWMLIPILPHLNTSVFSSEEILHDRFLYLSMVGVGLLGAIAMMAAAKRLQFARLGKISIAALILIGLSLSTVGQNMKWGSEAALWTHAAANAPNSRITHMALGRMAEERQDYQRALEEYDAALRVNPDIIDALNDAGLVYARLGRWDEAIANFEHITALTPNKAVAHFNLSVAYAAQKRYADAAREQQIALSLDPGQKWRTQPEPQGQH